MAAPRCSQGPMHDRVGGGCGGGGRGVGSPLDFATQTGGQVQCGRQARVFPLKFFRHRENKEPRF